MPGRMCGGRGTDGLRNGVGVHPRSILIKTEGGRKDSRTDGAISTDNGLSFSGRRASRAVVYLPSFLPSFLPYLCLLAEAPFAQ